MQENIELSISDKIQLKTVSAQQLVHMKDMLLEEAREIIDNNYEVPRVDREPESNRCSLIIKIDDNFKQDIKYYCDIESVRIRDFWVECVHRILERYNYE